MAQNITLLGASYSDVPAVELPKTGGGTASFTDVSDTTATASDVASGKYFYTAAGAKTQGTATGGGSRLPSGYTEVEYVSNYYPSLGGENINCYLNTGYIPKSTTRVECEFSLRQVRTDNRVVFGVVGQFTFRQYWDNSVGTKFRTNGANNVDFVNVSPNTARHKVIKVPTATILDYEHKVTTAATVSKPLYLLGYNGGSSNTQTGIGQIYSFKIYEGNTLKIDYVPCKNPGNVAGFYDLVSGSFYPSSGSVAFYAGPTI